MDQNVSETTEIDRIQSQELRNAGSIHRRHKPGVMHLNALNFVLNDQFLPAAYDGRRFRQHYCDALDRAKAPVGLIQCQTQPATRGLRPRANIPEFAEVLQHAHAIVAIILDVSDCLPNDWVKIGFSI